MAHLQPVSSGSDRTLQYNNLLGVDFQSDITEVNRRRSPDMVNMISDLGGKPIKRNGYRNIGPAYIGFCVVNGKDYAVKIVDEKIHAVEIDVDDTGKLVEIADTERELSDKTTFGEVKNVFGMSGYLYVMCENGWIEYDVEKGESSIMGVQEGVTWKYDEESTDIFDVIMPKERFIPTVSTLLLPRGILAPLMSDVDLVGATEGVNILTPFRMLEYEVTSDTATEVDFNMPMFKAMSGVYKVEVLDSNTFEWREETEITAELIGNKLTRTPDGTSLSQVEAYNPTIKFSAAPYTTASIGGVNTLVFKDRTDTAVPAGQPNVRITMAPFDMEELEETEDEEIVYAGFYKKRRLELMKSNITTIFDSKLFVATGTHIYYSRSAIPYKMDDNYYFDVDNNVVTFARTSYNLAIISEDVGNNTIYLASGDYSDNLGMTAYSLKASNANVGAVSSKCLGLFSDEPMFLSKSGIYGIQTNLMSDKYAVNRSGKINRRLCKEPNLENAVGISFNGYFYVYINNSMYILDSRHREESRNGDKGYECYYFDNLPDIKNMFIVGNRMFFADENNTYTWNDDLDEKYRYLDNATYNQSANVWDGEPVKAKWSSVVDSDDYPMYYKTLNKKGTMVTLLPKEQTSCEITIIKDGNEQYYLGQFDGTTFSLSDAALDAFTRKKIKKYKRLQFVIENNEAEPFGITNISKVFTMGNLAKR